MEYRYKDASNIPQEQICKNHAWRRCVDPYFWSLWLLKKWRLELPKPTFCWTISARKREKPAKVIISLSLIKNKNYKFFFVKLISSVGSRSGKLFYITTKGTYTAVKGVLDPPEPAPSMLNMCPPLAWFLITRVASRVQSREPTRFVETI